MRQAKLLFKITFYIVCYVLFSVAYVTIRDELALGNQSEAEVIEQPDQEEIILPEGVFGHIKIAG